MARMSDEAFDLLEENREKKITGQSARNRRGNTGKRGSVRLPSDRLTDKQLEALNGKCETYCLGKPMTWAQFKAMPDDLKIEYVKKLRKKYSVPDYALAEAMGVSRRTFGKWMWGLGLDLGRQAAAANRGWYDTEDCDHFVNFWCGVKEPPKRGVISIEGDAMADLLELADELKGVNVRMTIEWTVVEE